MRKKRTIILLLLLIPSIAFAQRPLECLGTLPPTARYQDALGCIFDSIVAISGLCALLMIVIGGFQWMTSAGDIARIADAKEKIFSAILGLLIVLCSVLILRIIGR